MHKIFKHTAVLLPPLFRWVLFTSIFFHANVKHIAYEIFILLATGSASEAQCGSVLFASIFFAGGQCAYVSVSGLQKRMCRSFVPFATCTGILGQIVSWYLLRREQIRDDPKYGAMLADLCLWRGSSGCAFTAVGLAISIAGGADLCDFLPARIFPNSLAPIVAAIWLVIQFILKRTVIMSPRAMTFI